MDLEEYLQKEGVLLVRNLQRSGAPHFHDGGAGHGEPWLG